MCVVSSLPLVLTFFSRKLLLDMYKPPQNLPIILASTLFFFRFKLFEEKVVQGSQVFVDDEVTIRLRLIDA